jgi:hypothetical protein
MAATATLEDSATATDNWPQDDQSIAAGNEQTANGASLAAVEERSAGQDTEQPQDHTRSSSAGAAETFRERQVKVLRSFLSVFACSFEARPSVWHSRAGLVNDSWLFLFLGELMPFCI